MNPGRLRAGEWLALLAAVGLLVVLALDWFGLDVSPALEQAHGSLDQSGYEALGIVMLVLLLVPVGLALTLAVVTALGRPVAWPVAAATFTTFTGIIAFVVLAFRVLLFQPDFGAGLSNDLVEAHGWAYLGLLLAALVPLGGWITMADERTGSREAQVTPPPAQPVPGA